MQIKLTKAQADHVMNLLEENLEEVNSLLASNSICVDTRYCRNSKNLSLRVMGKIIEKEVRKK